MQAMLCGDLGCKLTLVLYVKIMKTEIGNGYIF